MFAIILLIFIGAAGIIVWAAFASIAGRVPLWTRVAYLLALCGCTIASYFTTFRYTYPADANTRFRGWPVPTVIFQRDGPNEPWLDYVGPTVVLAYPMNLVLFAILPAFLVLFVYRYWLRSLSVVGGSSVKLAADDVAPTATPTRMSDNPYDPPSSIPAGGG